MTPQPLIDVYGPALERLRQSLGDSAPASEVAQALAGALTGEPAGSPAAAPLAAPFAAAVQSAVCLALYAVADPEPVRDQDRTPAGADDAPAESGGAGVGWVREAKAWATEFGRSVTQTSAREAAVPPPPYPPAPVRVSVAKVLDGIRGALEAADQVIVATVPRQPEPRTPPWTEDDELIDMLHDVLAAGSRGREGFALARIADLEETLRSRGIQAVRYDAAGSGPEGDAGLFDFVEGARPGAPGMTLLPALLDLTADGRALRRGRVRPPAAPRTARDGVRGAQGAHGTPGTPGAHTD